MAPALPVRPLPALNCRRDDLEISGIARRDRHLPHLLALMTSGSAALRLVLLPMGLLVLYTAVPEARARTPPGR